MFCSWGTPLHSSRFPPSPAKPKGGGWQVSVVPKVNLDLIMKTLKYLCCFQTLMLNLEET